MVLQGFCLNKDLDLVWIVVQTYPCWVFQLTDVTERTVILLRKSMTFSAHGPRIIGSCYQGHLYFYSIHSFSRVLSTWQVSFCMCTCSVSQVLARSLCDNFIDRGYQYSKPSNLNLNHQPDWTCWLQGSSWWIRAQRNASSILNVSWRWSDVLKKNSVARWRVVTMQQ